MPTKRNGFTLIELLVVIAIIAVLSTVGLVVYSSIQKNARISKRLQDLDALKTSIESYRASTGTYPKAIGAGSPLDGLCIGITTAGGLTNSSVTPAFVPGFMQILPKDPSSTDASTAPCYKYRSDAGGIEYKLWTFNTTEMTSTDFATQPNYIDPERDGGTLDDCTIQTTGTITSWAVYSSAGTASTNSCAF